MKTNKIVLSLLGVSLAINLACVGFLLGQRVSQTSHFGPEPLNMFPRWAHTLPEPRRTALLPMLRQQRQEARTQMRQIRRAHTVMHATLATDEFNEAALMDSLEQLRERLVESQNASHEAFVDFVNALSADERKQLAAQLLHQERRPRPTQRLIGSQSPRRPGALPHPRPKAPPNGLKPFIQPEN